MKLQTKTLIHYIINTTVILLTACVLVLTLSLPAYSGDILTPSSIPGVAFGISAIVLLILYPLSTLLLSNDNSKPLRILLPLVISFLVMSLLLTFIVSVYENFFSANEHKFAITNNLWGSLLMIFVGLLLIVIIMCIQVYASKFLLISLAGNRPAEWEIQNFYFLHSTKSEIKHTPNYSYLFNKERLLVIRFITENEIERKIQFEDSETISKSVLISDLEKEISRIESKLNSKVYGSIVYLSNKIPATEGNKPTNIKLIKNNNLFYEYKKLDSNIINIEQVKEVI